MTMPTFELAAETYNNYAVIQDLTAEKLIRHISKNNPKNILDIGCGTGLLTQKLAKKYPLADINAIDSSPAMIHQVMAKNWVNVTAIHDEYCNISIQEKYDLIASNAALHWMNAKQCLKQISVQLTENGHCHLAIFGRNTSSELEVVLQKIRKPQLLPAQQFPTTQQVIDWGRGCFSDWHVTTEYITLSFKTVKELFSVQKKTGVNSIKPNGLWTPRTLISLERAFTSVYNQIQLTYEIHFCRGRNIS